MTLLFALWAGMSNAHSIVWNNIRFWHKEYDQTMLEQKDNTEYLSVISGFDKIS